MKNTTVKKKPKAKAKPQAPSHPTQFRCVLGRTDRPNDDDQTTRLEKLVRLVAGRFKDNRSRTSRKAVSRLVMLAEAIVQELLSLSSSNPDSVRDVAKYRTSWPVLTSLHTAVLKRNADWIDSIGLSAASFNSQMLEHVPLDDTEARIQTLRIMKLVDRLRSCIRSTELVYEGIENMSRRHEETLQRCLRQNEIADILDHVILTWPLVFKIATLPDLADERNVVKEWDGVVLELLQLSTGGCSETIPELHALGEPRRFHPLSRAEVKECGFVAGADDPDFPLKTQNSNIMNEIRSKIREQIPRIARAVTKMKPTSG